MLGLAAIVATLDPRLALMVFLLLLLAAATPIVWGWLALLPAELEPFTRSSEERRKKLRDPFAIFLLANISLSLLLRIPGLDSSPLVSGLSGLMSAEWVNRAVMIGHIWFGFVAGLAVAYAAVRANPLRRQLLIGGALTLVLWFVGPALIRQIAGTV
jgi:hypothetical protein